MTCTKPLKTGSINGIAPKPDTTKRVGFIDQCKGLGILLMIRGHCATDEWEASIYGAHAFRVWIYSFHMPLFFLLGGCLLAYRKEIFSFPKTLTKKASRQLLPGLYFSLPMIAIHFLVKMIAGDDYHTYLKENLTALFTVEFYGSMWFLTCYFCAELVFLLLMEHSAIKCQALVISAFCFAGAVFTVGPTHIMVRISRLLMSICFIGIGYRCLSR